MKDQDPVREAAGLLAEFVQTAVGVLARTASQWCEEHRSAIQALARLAGHPLVRDRAPGQACLCLCAVVHPEDEGICEPASPVTVQRYESELLGPVDVPLCAPCATARLLAEMAVA